MKLNLPDMRDKSNPTGEHGPDPVVKSDLPLIRDRSHTHTMHKLDNQTSASEFAQAKK